MSDLQAKAEQAQRLHALAKHPSWHELKAIVEREEAKFVAAHGASFLRRGCLLDQRDIDFKAGFIAGAKWLLAKPAKAEATLEQALQKERQ
jgi:hypothetical protein